MMRKPTKNFLTIEQRNVVVDKVKADYAEIGPSKIVAYLSAIGITVTNKYVRSIANRAGIKCNYISVKSAYSQRQIEVFKKLVFPAYRSGGMESAVAALAECGIEHRPRAFERIIKEHGVKCSQEARVLIGTRNHYNHMVAK